MEKTIKVNKDNDKKFLNGVPGYESTNDDSQVIKESSQDEEKLEYFTE
jgi:hypothetical protein